MLGDKIFMLREQYGMSQVALAEKIGKSKQSISNWENNNILPSIDMLIKLSEVFNVSCDYLLGLDNRKFLEISGLDNNELAHLQLIINDLKKDR